MPTFKEIAGNDPRVRQLLLIIAMFIVGPLVFSVVKHPDNWFQAYVPVMLYAFSFPILVLAGMLFSRWRNINRLAENGVQVDAVAEKTWQSRDGGFASMRFTLNGIEHSVTVRVRDAVRYALADGTPTVFLVEPARPKNAAVLKRA